MHFFHFCCLYKCFCPLAPTSEPPPHSKLMFNFQFPQLCLADLPLSTLPALVMEINSGYMETTLGHSPKIKMKKSLKKELDIDDNFYGKML